MKTACILVIFVLACSASAFKWPSFTQLTRTNQQPAHCCQCSAKILRGADKTKIGVLGSKKAYADVFGDRGDCSESFTDYKGLIDWGDGKETRVSHQYAQRFYRTHEYANHGCYHVQVCYGHTSPFCGDVILDTVKV